MKRTIKTIVAMAAVAAAVSFSPLSASAAPRGDCPYGPERHIQKMETDLGLSPQQKKDVAELFAQCRTSSEPLRKKLADERLALRNLIHADKVDEAAIRAQSAKVAAVESDLAVQRAQSSQRLRALLTPEQAQKLKSMHDKQRCDWDQMPPCRDRHHRRGK